MFPFAVNEMIFISFNRSQLTLASRERVHADAADFNAVSDEYSPPHRAAAPPNGNAEASLDVVQSASELNCHGFDTNCRWSNTNEDELDWTVLMSTPNAEPWLNTLRSTSLPGPSESLPLYRSR